MARDIPMAPLCLALEREPFRRASRKRDDAADWGGMQTEPLQFPGDDDGTVPLEALLCQALSVGEGLPILK